MFEFTKENDLYLLTVEKVKHSNNIEYWLELTDKKTLMTQTLITKNKHSINFLKDCTIKTIVEKLRDWKIPKQKVYKRIDLIERI